MPNLPTPEFDPLGTALKRSVSFATYAPTPDANQQRALHVLEKTTRRGKIEHLLGMVADVTKILEGWKPEKGGHALDFSPQPLIDSFVAGRGAEHLRNMKPADLQRVVDTLDPRTGKIVIERQGQKRSYATRGSSNLDPSRLYIEFDAGKTPPSYVDFEHEQIRFGGRQFATAELRAALYGQNGLDYNIVPNPRDKNKPSLAAAIFIPVRPNAGVPNPQVLTCFMKEAEMQQLSALLNAPLPVRPPPTPGVPTLIRNS